MENLIGAADDGLSALRLALTGTVPEGQQMFRRELFDGLYASLPRDPEARVWIYSFEFLPKAYTVPHLHNGATFFLLLQGAFEAHFDDGTILRAKAGDVYSEPIGKVHRGHNPRDDIAAVGISFSATSPDREHITNVAAMANDPVGRG